MPATPRSSQGTAVDVTHLRRARRRSPIPTLVGLTRSEATNALTAAGLTLGTLDTKDAPTCRPTPCSRSDPQEGTLVDAGQRRVARRSPPARSRCRTSSARARPQAKADLGNAGFQVDVIQQEDGSVGEGTVLAQSPTAGTLLAVGKTVTITVAKAPPPTAARRPTPTSTGDA